MPATSAPALLIARSLLLLRCFSFFLFVSLLQMFQMQASKCCSPDQQLGAQLSGLVNREPLILSLLCMILLSKLYKSSARQCQARDNWSAPKH